MKNEMFNLILTFMETVQESKLKTNKQTNPKNPPRKESITFKLDQNSQPPLNIIEKYSADSFLLVWFGHCIRNSGFKSRVHTFCLKAFLCMSFYIPQTSFFIFQLIQALQYMLRFP